MTLTLGDLRDMRDRWREDGTADDEIVNRLYPLIVNTKDNQAAKAMLSRRLEATWTAEFIRDYEAASPPEQDAMRDNVLADILPELSDEERTAMTHAGLALMIADLIGKDTE